jgi:hypothetical protein
MPLVAHVYDGNPERFKHIDDDVHDVDNVASFSALDVVDIHIDDDVGVGKVT